LDGSRLHDIAVFLVKTIAVILLMFLTVLSPTLTFGAMYGNATNNSIGAIEAMLATSWVGITYSLIGGMPMCIIGSTGPVLAFTTALYNISETFGVNFLPFYAWSSVWIFFYCVIASFFDLTRFVRFATRFTDEIFELLIVSIFVMNALGDPFSQKGLMRYLDQNHHFHEQVSQADPEYSYMETALLSIILGIGTTWLIFFIRRVRFSSFCCGQGVRNILHDFAVTFSVATFTIIKQVAFPDVPVERLNVPESFEPTYQCCTESCVSQWPDDCPKQSEPYGARPWMVDFRDNSGNGWMPVAAAGPALLGFLLVYLDNGITWHLVNNKSHNLKHGEAYNYDLLLSGLFNLINGMLGLPWLVASTVPCLVHLEGLAEIDRDGNYLEVQETRLTMLFSHLMLAVSMIILDILTIIPIPVLYGVFLFMGLSILPRIQFWQRLLMMFQQPSKYHDLTSSNSVYYTEYMKPSRIHRFTLIQILLFGLIFVVQNFHVTSLVFPLMTLLCIPARLVLLPKLFNGWELLLLDGEETDIHRWVRRKERTIQLQFGSNGSHVASGGGTNTSMSDDDDNLVEDC
jgi:hypothetical protein